MKNQNILPSSDYTRKAQHQLFQIDELMANVSDNKELLTQLLNVFLKTTPQEFERMRKALADNNLVLVAGIAHKFKSTFQSLGMRSVANHLENLQRLAQNQGDISEIRQLVSQISQDFDTASTEINVELIRLKS